MSSVLIAQENQTSLISIQCDSLLEHLYTYFGVDELREILANHPDKVTLKTWNVSVDDFTANVQAAIDYVVRD